MTLIRNSIPSPNYSTRQGATVRLIVCHTAEGALTYQSLGNYFANPNSQVSSHVGIDNTPNVVGEYVRPDYKAWTAANANPVAIQAELCAFAAWTPEQWDHNNQMLINLAQWIKEEAARFHIPIVKLTSAQAQSNGTGVCQHKDLGSWGGNHSDCGPNFPMDYVLQLAGDGVVIPPSPPGNAPPFPYPPSDYLGQPSPDPHCHSGFYGGIDHANVATWQTQMNLRGWNISADGFYGPQSASICRQFQSEKGLSVDGLVGPNTWAASWTMPITP